MERMNEEWIVRRVITAEVVGSEIRSRHPFGWVDDWMGGGRKALLVRSVGVRERQERL